jgi:rhamnogalacturonyl hydrolase YesR
MINNNNKLGNVSDIGLSAKNGMTEKQIEQVIDDFNGYIDYALEWRYDEIREGADDDFFDKYINSYDLFNALVPLLKHIDRDKAREILKDMEAIEDPEYETE